MSRVKSKTMIHKLGAEYWNAFRMGMVEVNAIHPHDYPTWDESTDPVKQETMRCLRHAIQLLRPHIKDFDKLFPSDPKPRTLEPIKNDTDAVISAKIAEFGA